MEDITTSIKWIDLGLPVLWADRNLGAKEIYDKGNYYAWGELIPKNLYTRETYLYKEDFKINKYEVPTLNQYKELFTKCTWTWINDYEGSNTAGFIIKHSNNHIFFPATYLSFNGDYHISTGGYWTSTYNKDFVNFVHYIMFHSNGLSVNDSYPHTGKSIRLIKKINNYISSKNLSSQTLY